MLPNIEQLRRDIHFQAKLRGRDFDFCSTWGLFSPRAIDEGTALLLDHMEISEHADCLDMGCGYGAIGIVMASLASKGQALLLDKDFVAVEYANKNLQLNRITNAEVILSNGLSHVGERCFDVIATNVPAKVGNEMIYLLAMDAKKHLRPGGVFYIVSLSGMRRFIERVLKDVFGNYEKCKQGRTYTVAAVRRVD